jgi:hypothetical protein
MEDLQVPAGERTSRRVPWNNGKLVGAKPPLKPSHVWSIRTKLQIDGRKRDLVLFNLAIDSSCAAVTSSPSASTMWRQADIRLIAQR